MTRECTDEFLKWLGFANAGMLHPGNVNAMKIAIQNLPTENPVLEIGSFCGLSTNVIARLLVDEGRRNTLITCDKWDFEGAENGGPIGGSEITRSDYRDFVKSTFKRNIEFFSRVRRPHTVELTSDEFFDAWERRVGVRDVFGEAVALGGDLSFCYIDGNHTYEFAKRDFLNTDRHLDMKGFILFDDSSEDSPFGVARLMQEILDEGRYRLVARDPNYLLQKTADAVVQS